MKNKTNLSIGEIYESEVFAVNNMGNGICRIESAVVFVPDVISGDRIKLKITKSSSNHCMGEAVEFIEKSRFRTDSDCEISDGCEKCGGCDFRNISYSHELEIKKSFVESALRRSGFRDLRIADVSSSGEVNGYRSKVIVRTDENGWGYYKKSTYEIAYQKKCLLHSDKINTIIGSTYKLVKSCGISMYDEKSHTGTLRGIYVREAAGTGEIMLCLILNSGGFSEEAEFSKKITAELPEIKSIYINVNREKTNLSLTDTFRKIHGESYIYDELCGLRFRISPESFYQVNHKGAEILYNIALKAVTESGNAEKVADLYCGTGTIGMCIAKNSHKPVEVTGVEIIKSAVDDAEYNAKLNEIENIKFVCGDVKSFGEKVDTAVIDPPRKGCSDEMIQTLLKLSPETIVYVSCNPDTMARDAKKLCESGGYHIRQVSPVDMFPRTSHIETVVLLSKLKSTTSIEVKIDLDEMDLSKAESKATYDEIKRYVLDNYGFKVSQLYIAQVKRKNGIIERENYNTGDGKAKVPQGSLEKEKAIEDALRYFKMI